VKVIEYKALEQVQKVLRGMKCGALAFYNLQIFGLFIVYCR